MIVFLTLLYCGVLAILVKLGIVKLTLFWKLSPLLWMLLLFVVLFIPMQWGAPSGPVNVYQTVVEVIPNVTGEVTEVPVRGLTPLEEGDVLFKIDPTPYQAVVDEFRSQLENAKQAVKQLEAVADASDAAVAQTEAEVDVKKSEQIEAAAIVRAAKAALKEANGKKEKAVSAARDVEIQVTAAQREYDRTKELADQKAASQSDLDLTEIQLTKLKNQLSTAQIEVRVSDETIDRAAADVEAAESSEQTLALKLKQLVETELPRARAVAREAQLAATSMIGDEHTLVATARAQLDKAEFELGETVVTAPSDGYVVGVTLRPGQRVASFPVRSWMSFVTADGMAVACGIPQFALRHVEVGQKAEVTFKLHPGQTFPAVVDEIVYVTQQGQLQPSGIVMEAPGTDQSAVDFGVRLKLDESADVDVVKLGGGAVGTAAIYTSKAKASHVIRKVMLRMEAWMNYIIPN